MPCTYIHTEEETFFFQPQSVGHTDVSQFMINFTRCEDRSDCVGAQSYLCGCWARMSPVLIISNPTIWCDSRLRVRRSKSSNLFDNLPVQTKMAILSRKLVLLPILLYE